jgi:V/A-type H+-transporting ATPase subunit I
MLVPMTKLQIIGLQPDFQPLLATLHRLGVLELIPLPSFPSLELSGIRAGTPDRNQIARLVELSERLDAILALTLPSGSATTQPSGPGPGDSYTQAGREGVKSVITRPMPENQPERSTAELAAEAERSLAELEPLVQQLTSARTALEAEANALKDYQDILERLLPVAEDLLPLEGYETIALVIQPAFQFVIASLRDELGAITQRECEILSAEAPDGAITCLLVFNRRFSTQVHSLLQSEQLSEVRLPTAYQGRPFREILQEISRRRAEIPAELDAVRGRLDGVARSQQAQLVAQRAMLLDRLDELRMVSQCLESSHTFALAGWIPERDAPALQRALHAGFEGRVLVERLPIGRADWAEMPVLIENPRVVRPFQLLLELMPPPRYGTIDPTPLIAFFFPLFFGVILGDVGYGLLLLGLALWLRARRVGPAWLQQGAHVMCVAALAAIAFGLAFGEFFGDLGHRFGLRPLVVDRADAIPALLLFSVGLGVVQVTVGLALGAVNGYLGRHYKEALSRAATLLGLVLVLVLVLLAVVADLLPRSLLTPSLVLLAVVVALLVYSVGILGPLEVLGVLGNVLSYTRLIAVGLASLILAQVANQLAGLAGSILLGAIVGALFHGLNLALCLFSPSIQSLRLQYVEFFGRFFQPGGRPFHPFCRRLARATELSDGLAQAELIGGR